ncbi:MAG: helix-turn-helix domain-containing protein [Imperialibacter sp.]|uniref:helix-turn-helix domain-containing protein n=1 Tax=Imperialibacter sp. TaxID=2038411 RepID=UPI0032F0240C
MKTILAGTCLAIGLLATVLLLTGSDSPPLAGEKTEIAMRNVGYRVLLAAGDSSSRVLPVTKVDNNIYLIRFENPLTFTTDTLVKVIHEALAPGINAKIIPSAYVVNVMECTGNLVVYSYQKAGTEENTLVPCKGRDQPVGCYAIKITFERSILLAGGKWKLGGLALTCLVLAGFIYLRKAPAAHNEQQQPATLSIGQFAFDLHNGMLKHKDEIIDLTAKEAKILTLFAKQPNMVLERDKLMKEVWEDEGVIVGRSLDMFVSKLRKKLQADHNVKITNVHGKGYKLEVS